MTVPTTGHLLDSFPYIRVGAGQKPLVVIPGFGDSMFSGRYPAIAARLVSSYFHRFTDDYTIYVISRPRGIPENYQIDDATEQYGQILDEIPTPADVLGISMGGLIGQELAARYPELVDRLVIAVSGYRVADGGRSIVSRWQQYAARHRWVRLRSELSRELYSLSDWRRYSAPSTIQTVGRLCLPRPAVPSDVTRSLAAINRYDAETRLADIESSTLVVGGSDDPFFPESVLRETADRIPDAKAVPIDGTKHGAFDERKRQFDTRVKAFLSETQSTTTN